MRRALCSKSLWRALTVAEAPAGQQLSKVTAAAASTVQPHLFASLNTSSSSWAAGGSHSSEVASADKPNALTTEEPLRRYRQLADKELWHEAWMYEDKFGTADDPIVVPSLESERIIGCTDPEDDNLVVWGILRENEPPRQFIEHGEFYTLIVVPYVRKVGDVLDAIAAGTSKEQIAGGADKMNRADPLASS